MRVGDGRAQAFFDDEDHRLYRDLLAEHATAAGGRGSFCAIWRVWVPEKPLRGFPG